MKLKRFAVLLLAVALAAAVFPLGVTGVEGTYEFSTEYKSTVFYKRLSEYTLIGDNRYDLLAVAFTQLGYHEGDSDADMHGYSNGDRNFVEYNRLRSPLDNGEGNGVSYGYEWCASFVTWCLRHADIPHKIGGSEIGCNSILSWYKRASTYHSSATDYVPLPGDIILFGKRLADGSENASHVGIVVGVDGDTVYTIEGNNGGEVATHSYDRASSWIVGYCVPAYTIIEDTDYSGFLDEAKGTPGEYIVTAETLNIRALPNAEAKILGALAAGERVSISEIEGEWGLLSYGDGKGYISLSYAVKADRYICALKLCSQNSVWSFSGGLYGSVVSLPTETPEAEGKEFVGWASTVSADTAEYLPGDEYTLTGDATLYALWKSKYKVEFFDDDGTLLCTQYCSYGEKPSVPDAPEKEGTEFTGWTPEPDRPIVSDYKFYATYADDEESAESSEPIVDAVIVEKASPTEIAITAVAAVLVVVASALMIRDKAKKKRN